MKKISIVSPTFNEEKNIDELISRVYETINRLEGYEFEYIIIDNDSQDNTQAKLIKYAEKDRRIKLIFNNRNFGHIRSPYWALLQAKGDAVIYLASDLQDPPEYISKFIQSWELGEKVVMAVKPESEAKTLFNHLRRLYYKGLNKISDIDLTENTTGFGLYDKEVMDILRGVQEPYPYLRGLINELGYKVREIEFIQPERKRGVTKNNFYSLYDIAILGVVNHSNIPIRMATFTGLMIGLSLLGLIPVAILLKIYYWEYIQPGVTTIVTLMLFLFGLTFVFLGIIGEYLIKIDRNTSRKPIVVEKKRINFEE